MPLGPRWHDYTYREGDAFYGARPRPIAMLDATVELPSHAQATPENAWIGPLRSMNGAVSAVRRNILSALYTRPVEPTAPGFEVVRPQRASPPS